MLILLIIFLYFLDLYFLFAYLVLFKKLLTLERIKKDYGRVDKITTIYYYFFIYPVKPLFGL
jgi:hypothetical protein